MKSYLIVALLMTALPRQALVAQSADPAAPSVVRTAIGSVLGVGVGALVGAYAGGDYTSRDCPPGAPDACLGAAFPGFLWGAGVGGTVGAPIGAWLGSGRNGNVGKSLVLSTAILAAEVLALRSLVHDGRTEHEGLTLTIVAVAPLLQVLTSTYLHAKVRR
jgi:uncharacterized membrane protein YfcA